MTSAIERAASAWESSFATVKGSRTLQKELPL